MRPSPITEPDGGRARADLLCPHGVELALALLVFVGALFAAGVLALALGCPLRAWLLWPAAAAGIALAARAGGARGAGATARAAARAALGLGAVVGLALALGACCYDVSWDGQVYHQQAVLALAEGWNPLRDAPLSVAARPDNLWIDHYPKAAWICQAVLTRATGSLEASKGLQLVPLVAAGLLVHALLRARGLGLAAAALASALLAANPVVIAQSMSFYCDGLSASLMTALQALIWFWLRRPSRWLSLAFAATVALLVNLKFTGLVYTVGMCGGLALYARARHRERFGRFALLAGAAVAVATLGLGFDPYVTNLLRKGHPFYPLMGQGAVDIINIQLVPEFHAHSRPVRLLLSLFARADAHNAMPVLKWPFEIARGELRELAYADLRMGGFGPLYSACVLAAAALTLARRRLGMVVPAGAWALAALILGVSFTNPALWWARYVPQLWLLPAGALALALSPPAAPRARVAALILGGLLAADVALVAGAAIVTEARATRAVREQLDRVRLDDPVAVRWDGFDAVRVRLRDRNIRFREVAVLPCASPEQLRASRAAFCPAGRDWVGP